MPTVLSKRLNVNVDLFTGEQAYDYIINQLESEILECEEILRTLRLPQVKEIYIKNWTPNQVSFTLEDWGG